MSQWRIAVSENNQAMKRLFDIYARLFNINNIKQWGGWYLETGDSWGNFVSLFIFRNFIITVS